MVFFIVLITLFSVTTSTKFPNIATRSLNHLSDRGLSSQNYIFNPYKTPQESPSPDVTDEMLFALPTNPDETAEKSYPYKKQSISDKLNEVSNAKLESASFNGEIDTLTDPNVYNRNPLHLTSNSLSHEPKDRVSKHNYSPYSKVREEMSSVYSNIYNPNKPNDMSSFPHYVNRQEDMLKPHKKIPSNPNPIEMTYLPYEVSMSKNINNVVPQWTLFPDKVEYIVRVLKENLEMVPSSDTKLQFAVMQQYQPWVHYTLLITVCLELINEVVTKGEDAYEQYFDQTIIESVNKVTANPQAASDKITRTLEKASQAIAPILRYINNVIQSEVCFVAVDCDSTIEHALVQTSNLHLKLQAILLQASINLADIFMNQHAEEFEQAAKEHKAFEYVFNIEPRELAPLVAAGYTVKMMRKYLTPGDKSAPFKW